MQKDPSSPQAADERVDLVDERNRVIGQAMRSEVRRRNLLHRGVGILCWSPQGKLYVHRRTTTKDLFAGLYDMFVGGVVKAGEDELDAARREIREELGIDGPEPIYLTRYLYTGPHNRAWVALYEVEWDGPIHHQESEVAWGAYLSLEELLAQIDCWEFVPDGLEIFQGLYRDPPRQSRLGSRPGSENGGAGGSPPRKR